MNQVINMIGVFNSDFLRMVHAEMIEQYLLLLTNAHLFVIAVSRQRMIRVAAVGIETSLADPINTHE